MFLGLALLAALFSRTVADPDLWGHLKFGLDFLDTGRVIRPDPYSYVTGDQLWYNHEWLAEAIFALVYRLAGAPGLIWFKLLTAVAIGLIIYAALRRAQLAPLRAWTIVALSAALLSVGVGMVRPHLFTYLGFALLLDILVRAESGQTRWLIALPPLFAIWTNAHGGFLAGIAVLLLWTFTSIVLILRARVRSGHLPVRPLLIVVATTLACLLATLINPYGTDLWRFLLETATVPRPEITEWQAIAFLSPMGLTYLALLTIGGATLVANRRPRSLFRTLCFICLGLAPLVAVRHAPLFAIAMPLLLAPELADAWSRLPEGTRTAAPRRSILILIPVMAIAAVTLFGAAWTRGRCLEIDPKDYPIEAVEVLKRAQATGNLAVHFNWGEYVIWQLGPGLKVSLDGRRETVYSPPVYAQGVAFMRGTGDWDALLNEFATDYVLVPQDGPAANLMRLSPGWRIAHEDDLAALFLNIHSPTAVRLPASGTLDSDPAAQPGCFR
jgi:hypothetical protein